MVMTSIHTIFFVIVLCVTYVVSVRHNNIVNNGAMTRGELHFVSFGDWGEVNPSQLNVAQHMANTAKQIDATFVLNLGDNFYQDGVANDTDPQWKYTYENSFKYSPLDIPWISMLGNHDHDGVAQAQIDFYNHHRDNRWYMPDYYYTITVPIDATNTLEIVVIDTVPLDPDLTLHIINEESSVERRTRLLRRWNDPILARQRSIDMANQWQWIHDTLSTSTAQWLFVAGHYPVYSAGPHGDSSALISKLKPMLDEFGVDAYLSGHDHTLQYLQSSDVHYYVSGNAAKHDGKCNPRVESQWCNLNNGYSYHIMNATTLMTQFNDEHGNKLNTIYQKRRA